MKNSENPSRLLHSLFITMLLAVSCASCLFIPHIHSLGEKGIANDSLSRIQPGKTTKEEVLLAFGCPTWESQTDESSTFTYDWMINTGYWGFVFAVAPTAGAGGGAGGTTQRIYSLTVHFDNSNRVITYRVEKRHKLEKSWDFH